MIAPKAALPLLLALLATTAQGKLRYKELMSVKPTAASSTSTESVLRTTPYHVNPDKKDVFLSGGTDLRAWWSLNLVGQAMVYLVDVKRPESASKLPLVVYTVEADPQTTAPSLSKGNLCAHMEGVVNRGTCAVGAAGKYLIVQSASDNAVLGLTSVKVYFFENVAENSEIKLSPESNAESGVLAVDGEFGTNGDPGKKQCAQTGVIDKPWIAINLYVQSKVSDIRFLHALTIHGGNQRNLVFYMANEIPKSGAPKKIKDGQCANHKDDLPSGNWTTIRCAANTAEGRYLVVQRQDNNAAINVCEIQIFVGDQTHRQNAGNGYCHAVGDPHFHTFDGLIEDFMGKCKYLVASTGTGQGDFQYIGRYTPYTKWATVTSWAEIIFNKGEDVITIKSSVNKELHKIYVNNKPVELPIAKNGYKIIQSGNIFIIEYARIGFRAIVKSVMYMKHRFIDQYLEVDKKWANKMHGICGNFDGNKENDLVGPSGKYYTNLMELGHEWGLKIDQVGCDHVVAEKFMPLVEKCPGVWMKLASDACAPLNSPSGPFKSCQTTAEDQAANYNDCRLDVCTMDQNTESTNPRIKGHCSTFFTVAQLCKLKDISWKKQYNCSESIHGALLTSRDIATVYEEDNPNVESDDETKDVLDKYKHEPANVDDIKIETPTGVRKLQGDPVKEQFTQNVIAIPGGGKHALNLLTNYLKIGKQIGRNSKASQVATKDDLVAGLANDGVPETIVGQTCAETGPITHPYWQTSLGERMLIFQVKILLPPGNVDLAVYLTNSADNDPRTDLNRHYCGNVKKQIGTPEWVTIDCIDKTVSGRNLVIQSTADGLSNLQICETNIFGMPSENMCSFYGHPHYVTFDGAHISYHGLCTYLLASYQLAKDTIEIFGRNSKWGKSEFATIDQIEIRYKDHTIQLKQDGVATFDGKAVDGKAVADGLEVETDEQLTRVESSLGIIIEFDGDMTGLIKIPYQLSGRMFGLCGNADGDKYNDLVDSKGNDVSAEKFRDSMIGESYVVVQTDDPASCHENPRKTISPKPVDLSSVAVKEATPFCTIISENSGPFMNCLLFSGLDYDSYLTACITDVMGAPNDRLKRHVRCSNLRTLADSCQSSGFFVRWESVSDCDLLSNCPVGWLEMHELCVNFRNKNRTAEEAIADAKDNKAFLLELDGYHYLHSLQSQYDAGKISEKPLWLGATTNAGNVAIWEQSGKPVDWNCFPGKRPALKPNQRLAFTGVANSPFQLLSLNDKNPSVIAKYRITLSEHNTVEDATNCPYGWSLVNGKCLVRHNMPATWSESVQQCKMQGATLAEYHTAAEMEGVLPKSQLHGDKNKLELRTALQCDTPEDDVLEISCQMNEKITVQQAMYGRDCTKTCVPGISAGACTGDVSMAVGCRSPRASRYVKTLCEGKRTCRVPLDNAPDKLGDPCYKVLKYLRVKYICQPHGVKVNDYVECSATTHRFPRISCAEGTVYVWSAMFGREDLETCKDGSSICTDSQSPNSLQVIKASCHGMKSCQLSNAELQRMNAVKPAAFCSYYFRIKYSCGAPSPNPSWIGVTQSGQWLTGGAFDWSRFPKAEGANRQFVKLGECYATTMNAELPLRSDGCRNELGFVCQRKTKDTKIEPTCEDNGFLVEMRCLRRFPCPRSFAKAQSHCAEGKAVLLEVSSKQMLRSIKQIDGLRLRGGSVWLNTKIADGKYVWFSGTPIDWQIFGMSAAQPVEAGKCLLMTFDSDKNKLLEVDDCNQSNNVICAKNAVFV